MYENNLLSNEQYGFRNKRSCALQLLHVMEEWNEFVDERRSWDTVYLDLAKAFDTTIGYLFGETEEVNLLKDPAMLKRLNYINDLSHDDRSHILYALDGLLRDAKTRKTYSL